jgi:hypothetical protein
MLLQFYCYKMFDTIYFFPTIPIRILILFTVPVLPPVLFYLNQTKSSLPTKKAHFSVMIQCNIFLTDD